MGVGGEKIALPWLMTCNKNLDHQQLLAHLKVDACSELQRQQQQQRGLVCLVS